MNSKQILHPVRLLFCLCLVITLSGCGKPLPSVADLNPIQVHKIEIAQGNIVNQNMLGSLRQGMDQRHVRLILGTPMLVDPFHPGRWNYIYSLEQGGEQRQQRNISVYFNEQNKLTKIDGDVIMQLRPADDEIAATKQTVNVPARVIKEPGLVGRLTGIVGLPEDTFVSEDKAEKEKASIWSKVGGVFGFGDDEEAPEDKQASLMNSKTEITTGFSESAPSDFRPVQPGETLANTDQETPIVEPSTESAPAKEPVPDAEAGLFDGLLRGISF